MLSLPCFLSRLVFCLSFSLEFSLSCFWKPCVFCVFHEVCYLGCHSSVACHLEPCGHLLKMPPTSTISLYAFWFFTGRFFSVSAVYFLTQLALESSHSKFIWIFTWNISWCCSSICFLSHVWDYKFHEDRYMMLCFLFLSISPGLSTYPTIR